MKSSGSMVPITFKYQQDPLVAPYVSSVSHNNGGVTNLGKTFVSESKKYPPNDDEGGLVV